MLLIDDQYCSQDPLRKAITNTYYQDEGVCVNNLLQYIELSADQLKNTQELARNLSEVAKQEEVNKDGVVGLMYQYDLTTEEGVLLMCLAEALLRIPDSDTENLLISDKLTSANWQKYLGISESSFINTTTWGLALTGKILAHDEHAGFFKNVWQSFIKKSGEPVIRQSVRAAIKLMSKEFVLGRDIEDALKRSAEFKKQGYTFSFDMLGEAALTADDAELYFKKYQHSIEVIGEQADLNLTQEQRASISVKLSALYPRYEFAHQATAVPVLAEKLLSLCKQAKQAGIGLTVDAEEANRLDMSLDIIQLVFTHEDLKGWGGFGLALQAYQKRALCVIDWLVDLARSQQNSMQVRLVKGAYWDSEIKQAQMEGAPSYSVFTRKESTDVSYLACAQKLLAAQDCIFPKFATHNAYSVAAIISMMGDKITDYNFEFQNLQGMGKSLHNQLLAKNIPCRIYAPVGSHEELLPYLVRRLLENGANSSFVNQLTKSDTCIKRLTENPMAKVVEFGSIANTHIPLPQDIFGVERLNSTGLDYTDWNELTDLDQKMQAFVGHQWHAAPFNNEPNGDTQPVVNPAKHEDQVGLVQYANAADVDKAISQAEQAVVSWRMLDLSKRCEMLNKAADLLEEHMAELIMLAIREAGKVLPDAINEIREAVDFCRYYAVLAEETLTPQIMPGYTGETNTLYHNGRGIMATISPWNFPIAIFTGQISAALVAGNCVLAKPAEQTSLCAARVVELFYAAGFPKDVLQLLPGTGEVVGQSIINYGHLAGVLFTGSTETAHLINKSLTAKGGAIVPLIAETGGMNVMMADSTALPEQLVNDVVTSAFGSAGQRCSALRVLFLQEDTADRVITMLQGAMAELVVGDPSQLATDIGPVIDAEALSNLQKHIQTMKEQAKLIYEVKLADDLAAGYFCAPCAFELSSLELLKQEVFGPILHVIRYARSDLDQVISQVNDLGYGLTFGIHSRIDSMVDYIATRIHAGNVYVNRNMIGAMVGVQPFGGQGLSGTGPKAGGPHYLLRLCNEKVITVDTTASGGNASLMSLQE